MEKKNNGSKLPVGIGIGMIAAGIAGAYYLYGTKEGSKNRAKVRGWVLRAKGEVLEKLENLKEVNEEKYNQILDTVMKKYSGIKNIDRSEIDALMIDLRKHWGNIKKHLNNGASTGAKSPAKKRAPAKKKKTTE
jgi:hypothetical protein